MPSCLNQIKIAFYIVLDRADLFLFKSTIIDRGVVIIVSIDALNCGRTPVETVVPAVLEVELLYEVMEKVESRLRVSVLINHLQVQNDLWAEVVNIQFVAMMF